MKAELETLRKACVDTIRARLLGFAQAEALAVCADYFAAREAYSDLLAGTVSSYSLAGRSVSKRDPAALLAHIDRLRRQLSDLTGGAIPLDDPDAPQTAAISFGAL